MKINNTLLFIFSAILLYTHFILWYDVTDGIAYESNYFKILFLMLISGGVWFIWAIYFIAIQRNSLKLWLKLILCTIIIFLSMLSSSAILVHNRRIHPKKFSQSIRSGLKEDCMKLSGDFPVKGDTIWPGDASFKTLAASIKILKPLYVVRQPLGEKNDDACIMICLNGFAGFSGGIIVLKNENDIELFKEKFPNTADCPTDYEKLDSCIYYFTAVN